MARSVLRPSVLVLLILLVGARAPLLAQETAGGESADRESAPTGSASGAYLLLYQEIGREEQALADRILGAGGYVEPADVARLAELAQEARVSLYGDLIDRSALLLMLAEERLAQDRLESSRVARVEEIMKSRQLEERAERANRSRGVALWSSLGASAAAFAVAFTFWYLSEWQDEQYFLATSIDDAVKHRNYFKVFSLVSYLSAGVGVLSAGVAIPVLARRMR